MAEGGEVAAGHVEDEGGLWGEGAFPDDGIGFAGGVVGGGEDEFGGGVAVGEGGFERGGDGEGGGDAGNDVKGDAGGAESFDLFVGAAEDEGVSGLEAEDGLCCTGVGDHHGVDLGLGDAGLATAFADGGELSLRVGKGEDLGGDEVVVEDDGSGL